METIGISCSCSNTEAFKLSNIAAECTSCSTVHTITDEPMFITRSITPLHKIAKQQAFEDMCISILHNKLNDAWIEEQLESMYRRDNEDIADWATCFQTDHQQFGVPF